MTTDTLRLQQEQEEKDKETNEEFLRATEGMFGGPKGQQSAGEPNESGEKTEDTSHVFDTTERPKDKPEVGHDNTFSHFQTLIESDSGDDTSLN